MNIGEVSMKRALSFLFALLFVLAVLPSEASEPKRYSDGTYLVGSDIQPGLYRVELSSSFMPMGYIERLKGLSGDFEDIISNEMLLGDGYFEIPEGDKAVSLQGIEIYRIDLDTYRPEPGSEFSDGIYLVGYDILPGTYRVKLEDSGLGMGYTARLRAVRYDFDDIIANDVVTGDGYLEIKRADFAVKLQGVTLSPAK